MAVSHLSRTEIREALNLAVPRFKALPAPPPGQQDKRFTAVAEFLNTTTSKRWTIAWTWRDVFSLLYNHEELNIPRKKNGKKSNKKSNLPPRFIPAGCVSVEEILRYVEPFITANTTHHAATFLNKAGLKTHAQQAEWTAANVQEFYRTHTADASANRLRKVFPDCVVVEASKLRSILDQYKNMTYSREKLLVWLRREKIIHSHWRSRKSDWTEAQLSSFLQRNRFNSGVDAELFVAPPPAAPPAAETKQLSLRTFLKQNPEYKTITPKGVIVETYRLRRQGQDPSARDVAEFLNEQKLVRSTYTHGDIPFNRSAIINFFYSNDVRPFRAPEPAWVTAALDQQGQLVKPPKQTMLPTLSTQEPVSPVSPGASHAKPTAMIAKNIASEGDGFAACLCDLEVSEDRCRLTFDYDGVLNAEIKRLLCVFFKLDRLFV